MVATGAATTIGRLLIGPDPAFRVSDIQFSLAGTFGLQEAIAFVLLGILCGVAAWAFIRLLGHHGGVAFRNCRATNTPRTSSASVIGLMMVVLTRVSGHSYVDGVGYLGDPVDHGSER